MKFLIYFTGIIFSLIITILTTNFVIKINHGVLFFEVFGMSFFSAFVGFIIWYKKYNDNFEKFLVLFSYILINLLFTYYITIITDRSLSSFIYFYSVENKGISMDIYDEDYFQKYIERRYDEAEKIGYLKCDYDKRICTPTIKTKLTYFIMRPIGEITGVLGNYNDFKNFIKSHKNEE